MSKNFLLLPVALEVLRDGMRWVFILFVYVFGGCLAMSGREFLGIGLQTKERLRIWPFCSFVS